MVFAREDVQEEHASDLHAHSPWALGGVSRLQCYIHALTSSVVTAQTTMQQLLKEVKNQTQAASECIAVTDEGILQAHRVESGDPAMVF